MLIACLQLRANIIPCVRDLYSPLEKRWTLGSEISFLPFSVWQMLPKTLNRGHWFTAKVHRKWSHGGSSNLMHSRSYKVWLERTHIPHQTAFKDSVPTMVCICAGRFTCHLCGGKQLSSMTHGHQYSHHQAKWRHQSFPSFVLASRTQVLLNQVLFSPTFFTVWEFMIHREAFSLLMKRKQLLLVPTFALLFVLNVDGMFEAVVALCSSNHEATANKLMMMN